MTNRQALMNWMDTLSNEEFIAQVLDRSSDLPERIDHALCLACKARHGGQCVLLPPEDAECPIGTANWLDMDNNNAADWSGSVIKLELPITLYYDGKRLSTQYKHYWLCQTCSGKLKNALEKPKEEV